MEICNKNTNYLSMLKGISFIGSSLITGISIYIQKVDHPSLISSLPTEFALSQFRERYKRVLFLQTGLTVSTVFSSFLTFISIYNSKCNSRLVNNVIQNSKNQFCNCKRGYLWLLGCLLVFSTLPYTYFWVVPINKKLLSKDLDPYSHHASSFLVKWGELHSPRTIILIAATSCFFLKLFKPGNSI